MRKLRSLALVAAFVTTFAVVGCRPAAPGSTEGSLPTESKTETAKSDPIVGTWEGQADPEKPGSKMEFEFKADGKYTMILYPENSEVLISGSYGLKDNHLTMNAEAVDMVNLPKESAEHEAEIEKNFLEEMKKEDLNSDIKFDGDDKLSLTVKGDQLELTRK